MNSKIIDNRRDISYRRLYRGYTVYQYLNKIISFLSRETSAHAAHSNAARRTCQIGKRSAYNMHCTWMHIIRGAA